MVQRSTYNNAIGTDDHIKGLARPVGEGDRRRVKVDVLSAGETDELCSWSLAFLLQGTIEQHLVHILAMASCQPSSPSRPD